MYIPIIPKDTGRTDFNCRDGEIDYISQSTASEDDGLDNEEPEEGVTPTVTTGYDIRYGLTPAGDYATATIRIALQEGDAAKATLMLGGEISRVDAAGADRITQAIVEKAAEQLTQLTTRYRRMGLHILPFRVYGMIRQADGSLRYPSPQAVMLPAEYPPHPEITASSVTDDTLTLAIRFTVRPQRLTIEAPAKLAEGESLVTYVSYPLYVPKADEISGTLGSVRSATGGNATGIRFTFLSTEMLKYSVAAPEKYYQLTGNENTGYHIASKAAEEADYTGYADKFGFVSPFPKESMLAAGSEADPMEWIADWEESGDGYLPASLPYNLRSRQAGTEDSVGGIENGYLTQLKDSTGMRNILLTRPMTFAEAEKSRRKATAKGVRGIRILGLTDPKCVAVLLGSHDGRHFQALRQWNPHTTSLLLTPPRLFHRLLLLSEDTFPDLALEVTLNE